MPPRRPRRACSRRSSTRFRRCWPRSTPRRVPRPSRWRSSTRARLASCSRPRSPPVLSPRVETFLGRLKETPNFVGEEELRGICEHHGDSPELVQAVIDAKVASKDDACRFWADAMNVAYVDPFVSVITDEAIEKIPLEVAKKVKAIGLYIFNGVLTVAMASPDDQETVKRLVVRR